jgi:arylsulfatase A-like enzyme/tetratricopeptide (TPR) repeat protein
MPLLTQRPKIGLVVAVALAILVVCQAPTAPLAAVPRLNILLVTIDTLRADRVGAYGGRIARTPHMDALAADGCLFEQATVQVPLTRASHVSILTGLQPFQHGIRDNFAPPLAPEHRTLADILKRQGYRTGGFVGSFILNTQSGLARSFDEFDDTFEEGSRGTAFFTEYQRRAAQVEERAGVWLERTARADTPFFAWVHFYDPHSPYAPPQPYASRYAAHPYEGEIAYTDEILGRLLGRLDRLGLRDRTLVVFISDHGESLGEHGEEEHGFFVYDSDIHVPLMIRLPGAVPRGVRVKAAAQSIDLVPTILDLAGLSALTPPGLPGRSLVPAMTARDIAGPVATYAETLFPRIHFGWSELRSVRMDGWKYIHAPRPELYDLTHDPGERRNLYAAEGGRAASLRSRLLDALGGSLETTVVATPAAKPDAATLAKLASLGYVSGPGMSAGGNADPKDKIAEFMAYGKAVRLGITAYERGDFVIAAKKLQAIVSAGRGGFDVSYYLGRAYLRLSDYRAAVQALQEAIHKLPTYTPSYIELSRALVGLKQYDQAMATLREGLARDPGNFQFHSHLGFIARIRRDLPTARTHYEAARTLEPNDFDVRMNLASILRDTGEPRLALAETDVALKLRPDDGEVHNQRGMLLGGLGDNTGATRAFERASTLEPANEMIWFNLGLARLRTGDRTGAVAAFEKSLALKPDFTSARNMLATARR